MKAWSAIDAFEQQTINHAAWILKEKWEGFI